MCKCQPARFRQVLVANVTTKVSGRVSVPLDRVLKLRLPPSQLEREWSLWPEFGWIPEICAIFQRHILRRHF
jgi:hypothetical protein